MLKFRGPGTGDSEERADEARGWNDEIREGLMVSVSSEKDGLSETKESSRPFWQRESSESSGMSRCRMANGARLDQEVVSLLCWVLCGCVEEKRMKRERKKREEPGSDGNQALLKRRGLARSRAQSPFRQPIRAACSPRRPR